MEDREKIIKTIVRNLHNPQIILPRIHQRTHWEKLRVWAVWGLFPKEPLLFHLGHLHILQKVRDLLSAGIDVRIVINDHIEGAGDDEEEVFKLQSAAETMARFFNLILAKELPVGTRRDLALVGSRLCKERVSERFPERQRKLSCAQKNLREAFRPIEEVETELRSEKDADDQNRVAKATRQLGEEQEAIQQKFGFDDDDYRDLHEMFVGKPKYSALITDWGPRFGALIAEESLRPDFILVGHRHRYIWTFYEALFKAAGVEGFPGVVLVKDFMNLLGHAPMESANRDQRILTSTPDREVKAKLETTARSAENCALSNTVDYLLIPRWERIAEAESYAELEQRWNFRQPPIVEQCSKFLIPLLREYDRMWAEVERISEGGYRAITNCSLFDFIAAKVGLLVSPPIDAETINSRPDLYDRWYRTLLDKATREFMSLEGPSLVGTQKRLTPEVLLDAFSDLGRLVAASIGSDLALYLTDKRYRDHSIHQTNVGALGWFLLECWTDNTRRLWEVVAEHSGLAQIARANGDVDPKQRKALVAAVWWSCALLHDHAYAASYGLRVLPRLYKLQRESPHLPIMKRLEEAYLAAVEVLAPRLLNELRPGLEGGKRTEVISTLAKLTEEHLGFVLKAETDPRLAELVLTHYVDTHGVLGSLNLVLNVNVREDPLVANLLKLMVGGILFHHVTEKSLSFEDNPFAFLLALCDEIQEWGRRVLLEDEYTCPMIGTSLGLFGAHPSGELILPRRTLRVQFEYAEAEAPHETAELGWSYDRFIRDKDRNFRRLVWPGEELGIFPSSMQYTLKIPSLQFGSRELKTILRHPVNGG